MKTEEAVFLVPKFHLGTPPVLREILFRADSVQASFITSRSAMKLPQQARSQVKLGNEGDRRRFYED